MKFGVIFLLPLLLLLAGSSFLSAQADTIPVISTTANVDLMSRYIWRGQDYGQAPSIQPGLSATWKDFTLGVWGAYILTGAGTQETDFYLSKEIGPLSIAVWDYWSFCDTVSMNFFEYRQKSTSHLLEAQVMFSGGEKFPLNLLGSYFFYGADPSRSAYFEIQYVHSLWPFDMLFFAGFQPWGSYYAAKAAFVNIGCTMKKNVVITEHWSLPVNISLVMNPSGRSVYLVAGITL